MPEIVFTVYAYIPSFYKDNMFNNCWMNKWMNFVILTQTKLLLLQVSELWLSRKLERVHMTQ